MVKEKAYNEDQKEKEIVGCDASMFYHLVIVKVHSCCSFFQSNKKKKTRWNRSK